MKSAVILFFFLSITNVLAQDAAKGMNLYNTCIQCHGEKGEGNLKEEAPRIGGQFDWYILASLKSFKSGERKNLKMLPYIQKLTEQDFKDLAAYVSTLK